MQPLPAGFLRYRWVGFSLLAAAFVLGFFHRIAPGVVAPDLMSSFGISAAALGSLAAIYYYVYTAMQIPAGILSDTLGPRYAVSAACLLAAVGSIVFGQAESFAMASFGRLLVGLGVSFTFVGLMKFNTLWFPENRYGLVSGITLLIGNAGAVLAATPLAWALDYTTWRQVFVGVGVVGAVLALLTLILLRNKPEDAGFASVETLYGLPSHKISERHWSRELYGALTNKDVWPGFIVMLGVTGTTLAFIGLWSVPLLQDVHGLDRAGAANYSTVMLLSSALGALFAGSLSDWMGRRKPLAILCAVATLLVWLAFLYLPWGPGWSAYVLMGLLGLCAGGSTVTYAIAKEVAPPLFAGMAIAIVNTGLFLGAALVQPLFGWAMDVLWQGQMQGNVRLYLWADYQRGLYLCAGMAVLALCASTVLKETRCRNITRDE